MSEKISKQEVIAENLKRLTKEAGMTQETLSEKMHVTRQTVSGWLNGNRTPPLDDFAELCDVLGVDMDYITGRISCKTHNGQSVQDATGIDAQTADIIANMDEDYKAFLCAMIKHPRFMILLEMMYSAIQSAISERTRIESANRYGFDNYSLMGMELLTGNTFNSLSEDIYLKEAKAGQEASRIINDIVEQEANETITRAIEAEKKANEEREK